MAIQNRKLLINHLTIFIQYLIHTFRSTRKREAVQKARSFVHINSVDKGSIIDIALYEYDNFMGRCNDDFVQHVYIQDATARHTGEGLNQMSNVSMFETMMSGRSEIDGI